MFHPWAIGSISYVHVKCLQTWRNTASRSAFFQCPQCHYKYRFSRTRVVGIATNPVIVGGISALIFIIITLLSSYITTYLLSYFQEPTTSSFYFPSGPLFYVTPLEVIHDLVRAALGIIQDEDEYLDPTIITQGGRNAYPPLRPLRREDGFLKRFMTRLIIGLPLVGSVSLIHMLLTLPFIGPVHWIARYRGNRRRNNSNSRDISALIIVALLVLGAARAFYGLYQLIHTWTTRALLKFEDSVLEVNA
ncbi:ring finger domain protein [Moniliophthora roreri]|uniref:RING-CH-type domain-containing protein n=1 Tax=Moniliophthora roreri TaxID=221103 RepID=A0A0W0G030_MONRR|nr:ring finger domain protein [Moniliophthora roreri]